MPDYALAVISLILGSFVAWRFDHFYSVKLRQPKLSQSGSGWVRNFYDTGFSFIYLSIKNELRSLSIGFSPTTIFGKTIKWQFGNGIIEREIAKKCTARLYDQYGKFVASLFWRVEGKMLHEIDIKSVDSASLSMFVRNENEAKTFYVYQPISDDDISPKTDKVPTFTNSTKFEVKVSYPYNKFIKFDVEVEIDYQEKMYLRTKSGGS
jgi:hypothetical protein